MNVKPETIYISYQRTFIYLLFTYFDGNIAKGINDEFLSEIGVNMEKLEEEFAKIINSVNYVLMYDILCLTNPQTIERYYTFYSFMFRKKQIIISLDSLLLKFCYSVLKKFTSL